MSRPISGKSRRKSLGLQLTNVAGESLHTYYKCHSHSSQTSERYARHLYHSFQLSNFISQKNSTRYLPPSEMSGIRRSRKTKPKGLVSSSNTTKRKVDNIPHIEPTTKCSHTTEIPPLITSPKGVKTRFLISSDTHGKSALPQKVTTNIDVVLHCGDLSEYGSLSDCENSIALLTSIHAPLKLVVPGNHDLSLDTKL